MCGLGINPGVNVWIECTTKKRPKGFLAANLTFECSLLQYSTVMMTHVYICVFQVRHEMTTGGWFGIVFDGHRARALMLLWTGCASICPRFMEMYMHDSDLPGKAS